MDCSKKMYYNTQQLYILRVIAILLIVFSIISLALSLSLSLLVFSTSNFILSITLILGIFISIITLLTGFMCLLGDRYCFYITLKISNIIILLCSLLYLVLDGLLLNYCYDYSYDKIDRNYCNNLTASFTFIFLICILSSIVSFVLFCFISVEESSKEPIINRITIT